jgi:hypothetical protein
MVDGVSGMDLLTGLLSPEPAATFDPGPRWRPRPEPSPAELLAGELLHRGGGALALLRTVRDVLTGPRRALTSASETVAGLLEAMQAGNVPASPTPLNPRIGPHRRFDWLRVDLTEVTAVKALRAAEAHSSTDCCRSSSWGRRCSPRSRGWRLHTSPGRTRRP